jgi:hypothetical protein
MAGFLALPPGCLRPGRMAAWPPPSHAPAERRPRTRAPPLHSLSLQATHWFDRHVIGQNVGQSLATTSKRSKGLQPSPTPSAASPSCTEGAGGCGSVCMDRLHAQRLPRRRWWKFQCMWRASSSPSTCQGAAARFCGRQACRSGRGGRARINRLRARNNNNTETRHLWPNPASTPKLSKTGAGIAGARRGLLRRTASRQLLAVRVKAAGIWY